MISQQGRVIAVEGSEVTVEIGGVSGCPACDEGKGCGAGIFGRLLRNRHSTMRLPNSINAVPGQAVELGISEQHYLGLVFRLYAWPLIAGLFGAILGFALASRSGQQGWSLDLWTLLAGVVLAALALWRSRRTLWEFPGKSVVHFLKADDANESPQCLTKNLMKQDIG